MAPVNVTGGPGERHRRDHHPDPFGFDRDWDMVHLRYIRNVEDSKALNDLEGPAVMISASGMCEAGRIQHHLKHTIGDPRNAALGRRLVERQPVVKIFGQEYPLRARVETINGHATAALTPIGMGCWIGRNPSPGTWGRLSSCTATLTRLRRWPSRSVPVLKSEFYSA